ncbi:hypothetical protein N9N67_10020, partial [Bacteriovoracaceae bacterium]|nr:hypothetical protein [Bacteriovoracaceae bacterium]
EYAGYLLSLKKLRKEVQAEILELAIIAPDKFLNFIKTTCSNLEKNIDEGTKTVSNLTVSEKVSLSKKSAKKDLCLKKNLLHLKQQILLNKSYKIGHQKLAESINSFIDKKKLVDIFIANESVLGNEKSIQEKAEALSYYLYGDVDQYEFKRLSEDISEAIAEKVLTRINSSKVVVESMIDFYYGETKNEYFLFMENIKVKFIEFFKKKFIDTKLLTNKKVIQKINSTYATLPIMRMTKPAPSYYIVEDGLEILNPRITESRRDTSPYTNFVDSSLSFFSILNASYSPHLHHIVAPEMIRIYPGMSLLYDYNRLALIEVLTHEFSHKIGPDVSWLNGHDISENLKPLINCFESQKSFKMMYHQAEEAFADWLAAEFVADYIEKNYSAENFEMGAKEAVGLYCLFDANSYRYASVDFEDPHPDSFFRVNAIFGTQPFIQKSMSCENSIFKYCSLSEKY